MCPTSTCLDLSKMIMITSFAMEGYVLRVCCNIQAIYLLEKYSKKKKDKTMNIVLYQVARCVCPHVNVMFWAMLYVVDVEVMCCIDVSFGLGLYFIISCLTLKGLLCFNDLALPRPHLLDLPNPAPLCVSKFCFIPMNLSLPLVERNVMFTYGSYSPIS